MDKIKEGMFEKKITETEKQLFNEPFSLQMDIYNLPTKDAYQNQLNKTMKRIVKISGVEEARERYNVLTKAHWNTIDDFEAIIKHLNDERKEVELKIYALEKQGKVDKKLQDERQKIADKIKNHPEREKYQKKSELIKTRMQKYQKDGERFFLNFIDKVNEDLEPIKDKKGFSEFSLNDDLTFCIQEKKDHKVIRNGEEFTGHLKVYKFEELDKDTKETILKVINKNFKKEYLKDETGNFLKSFKDTKKPEKKSEQGNLDTQLGINTKLYEKYGDMKTFGKAQKRLS